VAVIRIASLGLIACAVGALVGTSGSAQRVGEAQPAVLVGAGDVANCELKGASGTARLLDSITGTVFVAGDAAYASPRDPNPFRTCYDSTWGRHKSRTRPLLGNHDYEVTSPKAYFDYFGAAAGAQPGGYYSYDVGSWHVVALNSNIAMHAGSPQYVWLERDLNAHAGRCGVAIMHHPRFSSGPHFKDHARMVPFWTLLQQHHVTVAIAGHDHLYERFAPMRADGTIDEATGMREFVVGTGGGGHYRFVGVDTGSQVRIELAYGVLKLALSPTSYMWDFISTDPSRGTDHGESRCQPLIADSRG
jgi:hypothetical protein